MPTSFTWEQIKDFVLAYKVRCPKVFKNYSEGDILTELAVSYQGGGLMVTQSDGKIDGLAICYPYEIQGYKCLHVHSLLIGTKYALRAILSEYKRRFNGRVVTARRRGKLVIYDTPKTFARLWTSANQA